MPKNYSYRTFKKQIELAYFIKSCALSTNHKEFTFVDFYGGCGEYTLKGQTCVGSSIVAHNILSLDTAVKARVPKYNGISFELDPENYQALVKNVNKYCPQHNFHITNSSNYTEREVFSVMYNNDRLKAMQEAMYKSGIFYFDAEGDINTNMVNFYHKPNPDYFILGNLQRNTIMRWLSRRGQSSVYDLRKISERWLVSKPTGRIGWTWMLYVPENIDMIKLADSMNNQAGKPLIYTLESKQGKNYYKILTETGHHIADYE